MIDLTNKTQEELHTLYNELLNVHDFFNDKNNLAFHLYPIQIAVNYIKEKYNDIDVDWKAFSTLVIMHLFHEIKTEEDVKIIIDDFIIYINTKYSTFSEADDYFTSTYDKNHYFTKMFINNKKSVD